MSQATLTEDGSSTKMFTNLCVLCDAQFLTDDRGTLICAECEIEQAKRDYEPINARRCRNISKGKHSTAPIDMTTYCGVPIFYTCPRCPSYLSFSHSCHQCGWTNTRRK